MDVAAHDLSTRWVKLCIGGKYFETTWDTLCQEPLCYFQTVRRGEFFIERNSDGYILIDRDPRCFELILEFLRTGHLAEEDCRGRIHGRLLEEAKFYNYSRLVKLLDYQSLYDSDIGTINVLMRDSEMNLRQTYAKIDGPGADATEDGFESLRSDGLVFDVFSMPEWYWSPAEDEAAYEIVKNVPLLGECSICAETLGEPLPVRRSIVETQEDFDRNWDVFTHGLLRGLDWCNVLAAGGGVLHCLLPNPELPESLSRRLNMSRLPGAATELALNGTYEGRPVVSVPLMTEVEDVGYCAAVSRLLEWSDGDMDLFLYAMTEAEAEAKISHICSTVCSNAPSDVIALRTAHAITLICRRGADLWGSDILRRIQIILRLYCSTDEVLVGFDLDCCTVGFDGSRVLMLPRCRRAINSRCNLADESRQSRTYEYRLLKYMRRGFRCGVPGYDANRIPATVLESPPLDVTGLARLLILLHRSSKPGLGLYRQAQTREERSFHHQLQAKAMPTLSARSWCVAPRDGYLIDFAIRNGFGSQSTQTTSSSRLESKVGKDLTCIVKAAGLPTSDYTVDVGIARTWAATLHAIRRYFFPTDWFDRGRARPHPFVVYDLRNVENVSCVMSAPQEVLTFGRYTYLTSAPLKAEFIKRDAGRQHIGSFHPAKGNWMALAYGGSL